MSNRRRLHIEIIFSYLSKIANEPNQHHARGQHPSRKRQPDNECRRKPEPDPVGHTEMEGTSLQPGAVRHNSASAGYSTLAELLDVPLPAPASMWEHISHCIDNEDQSRQGQRHVEELRPLSEGDQPRSQSDRRSGIGRSDGGLARGEDRRAEEGETEPLHPFKEVMGEQNGAEGTMGRRDDVDLVVLVLAGLGALLLLAGAPVGFLAAETEEHSLGVDIASHSDEEQEHTVNREILCNGRGRRVSVESRR